MTNTESPWGGANGGRGKEWRHQKDRRGKEKEEEHKFKGKMINKDEISTRKDLALHSNISLHRKLLGMFSFVSGRGHMYTSPYMCMSRTEVNSSFLLQLLSIVLRT